MSMVSAVREADCEFTRPCPSAKALGYCHSVRFADVQIDFCSKATVRRLILKVRIDELA